MLVQYIHLCQCTPAYKWNMFYTYTWFVAHLPINGTCFTQTHDLLCEYIHLCKSTKRTRQEKQSPPKAQDKHNTTKYFILFQCTLTLIKVKSHWAHPVTSQNKRRATYSVTLQNKSGDINKVLCHMHTKLPTLFLAHPVTLHIFQLKPTN